MVFDLAFVVPEREIVFQERITILMSTFTSQMTRCLFRAGKRDKTTEGNSSSLGDPIPPTRSKC